MPLVSVIIPTRNRMDELREALASVAKQTIDAEVLVMDDASTDGTCRMVREEFPDVQVFPGDEPRGPTYRRNLGASLAKGTYLVTLDDDCRFVSEDTIAKTVEGFDDPRIGAVTIPFVNVNEDDVVRYGAPDNEGCYITASYFGGMVVFRKDVYEAMGGYRTHFFMHVEEADLALRMLDEGWVVRLGHAEALEHLKSAKRDRPMVRVLGPRNQILFAWHNVPMPYLPLQMLATTVKGLGYGFRRGHFWAASLGFLRGYFGIWRYLFKRKAVGRRVYLFSRKLRGKGTVRLGEDEGKGRDIEYVSKDNQRRDGNGRLQMSLKEDL